MDFWSRPLNFQKHCGAFLITPSIHSPIWQDRKFFEVFMPGCRERDRLKIETAISPGIDVRSDVALCLYRVTQECLQNIIKHSGAEMCASNPHTYFAICALENLRQRQRIQAGRRTPEPGLGLTCIKERVRSLGGRMEIETGAGRRNSGTANNS